MSLYIEVDEVSAVLLADGWHEVDDKTFEIDAYEFHHGDSVRANGGMNDGARWFQRIGHELVEYCCPIQSILAVRCSTSMPDADS